MKHSFNPACTCPRCTREAGRRSAQAQAQAPKRSRRPARRHASNAEQYGRYLDAGPQAWDDQGSSDF